MGIRETINQNPKQTAAITSGIVVLALLFIIWNSCGGPGSGGLITNKAFYTVDDGRTWFVDDATKIPPFQTKDGKMAVRVKLFTCDNGKTKFAGYLEMYDQMSKQAMEQTARAAESKQPTPPGMMGFAGQPMVKRPGDPPQAWIPFAPQTTQMYQAVMQVKCPGGQSQEALSPVFPDE